MSRIYVIAGQRFEPDWLVDDMKSNLSWADKICIVDDTKRPGTDWIDEGTYRLLQRQELEKNGIKKGDWILVTSPDERWEKNTGKTLRNIIRNTRLPTIYKFHLKEMFTPTEYRIDGIWGRKTRPRLYPYIPGQMFSQKRIQQAPTPITGRYAKRLLNLNIYHLKNIEPESREGRVEAYKAADPDYKMLPKNSKSVARIDPEGKYAKMGYDYLKDTEGMVLKKIPKGREFNPAYTRPYIFKSKG